MRRLSIIIIAIVCFTLFFSQALATTEKEKLTYGYNGVKWGTELSKNKSFHKVKNNSPIQFIFAEAYESPSNVHVVLEGQKLISAEKVQFICLKGKLAAISIIVKAGDNDDATAAFFTMTNYAKKLYGEPTSGSIDTSNEIFYDNKLAHMKIQLRTNPKRSMILIYAPKYDSYF